MNVYIINGIDTRWSENPGSLNSSLVETAEKTLKALGHSVTSTEIQKGFDPEEEAKRINAADLIIFQTPLYWFGVTTIMKEYLDRVLNVKGAGFYDGDGRHRDRPELKYGTGGMLEDKKYMCVTTCNAPKEAFSDPSQFSGGLPLDDTGMASIHYSAKFLAMQKLPSFVCYDVYKGSGEPGDYLALYKEHLQKALT